MLALSPSPVSPKAPWRDPQTHRQDLLSRSVLPKNPGGLQVETVHWQSISEVRGPTPRRLSLPQSLLCALQQPTLRTLTLPVRTPCQATLGNPITPSSLHRPLDPLLLIPFQNPLCLPCHLGPNLWAGEVPSQWPAIPDDRSRGDGLLLELFQYFPHGHCYGGGSGSLCRVCSVSLGFWLLANGDK